MVTLLVSLAVLSPIDISSTAVPLDSENASRIELGELRFAGGLRLASEDSRFGGISGFVVDDKRRRMVAISDRGFWFTFDIQHDPRERLVGVNNAQVFPMLNAEGRPLAGADADAEDLTRLADGTWIVSFEHHHRLARFSTVTSREEPVAGPSELSACPPNGGIEALASLPGGRLLLFREKPADSSGHFSAWLQAAPSKAYNPLTYASTDGFQPTGVTLLNNGDLLVLERRFTVLTGIAARLVRVPARAIEGEALIQTREIARFDGSILRDNYEALTAHDNRLYIGSDDNYNAEAQATLLVHFVVPEP